MSSGQSIPDQRACLVESARAWLAGYAQHDLALLEGFALFVDWHRLATEELESRARLLLKGFDAAMITGIVCHELQMDRVAAEFVDTLRLDPRDLQVP